jgi:hypothetical protein
MTLKVRDGGTLREITAFKLKYLGVERNVRAAKVYHSGALRTFYEASDPLTATASPSAQIAISALSEITSAPVTVTPTGGLAPYTYSWAVTSFAGTTPTIGNAGFATTDFSQINVGVGALHNCSFTCTVTDALGSTATAVTTVRFKRETGA